MTLSKHRASAKGASTGTSKAKTRLSSRLSSRITSYNVCYTKLLRVFCGLFIIGLIDNILRPVLVGHEAHIPEFVVLIATIAGLRLMGLNGVIIGPIIAALFLAAWKIATEWRDGFGIEEEEAET